MKTIKVIGNIGLPENKDKPYCCKKCGLNGLETNLLTLSFGGEVCEECYLKAPAHENC